MDAVYDALAIYGAGFLLLAVVSVVVGHVVSWRCPACFGRRRDPVGGACLRCRYRPWF